MKKKNQVIITNVATNNNKFYYFPINNYLIYIVVHVTNVDKNFKI